MATAGVTRESDFDRKFQDLEKEIFQTFQELFQALETRKQDLLSRLSTLKSAHDNNIQLDEAIKQLRIVRDNAVSVMTSNLLGEDLDPIKESFDAKIRSKEEMKVPNVLVNVNLIEFRCLSEQILKGIEETDLIELLPEYVGRENPILKKCSQGHKNGQFINPGGISIDRSTNEVYVVDKSNSRIQVMSINGDYLRSFTNEYLKAPYGICLSDNEVFVTDIETFLLKFHKSGKFLKKVGSRGTTPGCFSGIKGLCYEERLVYVCDNSMQQINIFDSELKYFKYFAYGEIQTPFDITIHANSIYILSVDQNVIYYYNKDCSLQNTIKLSGQKVPMTTAYFFTMDSRGNFLISNAYSSEIRIFSPDGVLKHSLGRGHLKILNGIALDNSGSIVCVNSGVNNACFQKY